MDYVSQYGKKNPEGISIRDYFAAKAINEVGWYENMDNSAAMAYLIADAMLKARGCK
jgi:hypothetical protein